MGNEDHVCLLKKSLYGLKQSHLQWYKKFDSFMISLNFSHSNYDSCVYLKNLDSGDYIYLLLYVDDMLIAATNMEEIKKLKEQLGMTFEMKDLGATKKILGMEITRDRSNQKPFLSQKEFAGKVIHRFGMEKTKVVSTPLAAHFKLSVALNPTSDSERSYIEKVPYSSAVENLMYLMVCI
jgi:Reverse transcriptase (RNA-dependent DNA polymerase)